MEGEEAGRRGQRDTKQTYVMETDSGELQTERSYLTPRNDSAIFSTNKETPSSSPLFQF